MPLSMRTLFFLICFSVLPAFGQSTPEEQEIELDSLPLIDDPLYREDQFYASISYNLIQNKSPGFSQNSFSTGLTIGFLRDMPVNKARTHALAAGLGYSYNNIHQNLSVTEAGGTRYYVTAPEDEFNKNKLVLHYIDLPIEFRWRNSNSVSHKFWRIYTGFKVSYLFADKAQFEPKGDAVVKVKGNDDLNKLVYGVYVAAGWNTWNLYAYYGLNPIYKSARLSGGENIRLNSLNLGLMFYIL